MNRENLANAELAAAINDSQTSITLKTGQGGNFTQFPLVCTMTPPGQLSTKDNSEVVLLTDVTSDTATITRAQYGFSAKSFPIGSIIANGIYKEDFDAIQDAIDLKYDASNPDGFVDATGAASASPVQSVAGKTGEVSLSQDDVGLPNVNDTSDAEKPVSTATQTALNAKANATDTVNLTGNQTVAGVKTFSSSPVVPTATTNTQAVNKAQMDTADALKVNKAGDTMTGPLESTNTSGVCYRQTRAAKNIGSGTSGTGNFSVYNFTNSFELFHAYSDGTGVSLGDSSNAPRLLHGTGFPDGVVSAPVGSTYYDKNATNGAIEWKKATGTGNTGWVVSVGDTGWIIPSSSLLVNTTSGGARVRRINAMVYLFFDNVVLNSGSGGVSIITAIPLGFRTRASERTIQGIGLNNNATLWQVVSVFDSVSYWCFSSTAGGNTSVRPSTGIQGTVQYVTDDAWPTTLP